VHSCRARQWEVPDSLIRNAITEAMMVGMVGNTSTSFLIQGRTTSSVKLRE
jgi:hypothetical protein